MPAVLEFAVSNPTVLEHHDAPLQAMKVIGIKMSCFMHALTPALIRLYPISGFITLPILSVAFP